MDTESRLQPVFMETLSQFTDDKETVTRLRRDIEKHYTHLSRHYYTLSHLDHLINTLQQVKHNVPNWGVLVLAITYHDIIYNIRKRDNEEKSAAYACKAVAGILPEEKQGLMSRFIIATKAHERNDNEDINYFTDADLSIFGSSSEEYSLYTKQIRKEYKPYPLFLYKPGRAKVIRHFLDMDVIFKTKFFHDKLEAKARENLQTELNDIS